MCGMIGMLQRGSVVQNLLDGLSMLQHRGQDATGIATCADRRLYLRKSKGLVRDVFHTRHVMQLQGNMGIGHVRYPTAGTASYAETQPLYVNSPHGILLAHNGNLTNGTQLRRELEEKALRHMNTGSDSEILLNLFAEELGARGGAPPRVKDLFAAVTALHQRVSGAYAVVGMIPKVGIFAFRDPHGIRPLIFGRREMPWGFEYLVASESVAVDMLGFDRLRDVAPGEAIVMDPQGGLHTQQCATKPWLNPCIFEYVYLARPDSILDGISIYRARLRMGRALAEKIRRAWPDYQLDVIIPVPETSCPAALELALELGLKYREGFVKNRYVPRTFIMPEQEERRKSVRKKLNVISQEFSGKRVLLVDDSIVRGTTSREIVQMARDAGALEVNFASASPPVRHPNFYGINIPSHGELIAHQRTIAEISSEIGADRVFYQELKDLKDAVREENPAILEFDCSCFDGVYPAGTAGLEQEREDPSVRLREGGTEEELTDIQVSA